MPRRRTQVLDSSHLMNTAQIFRESIRLVLLHPTHYHAISILFFSPLPISLFISHFLIHHLPQIPSSTHRMIDRSLGQYIVLPLPKVLSKTTVHIITCFPSAITFSLLGRGATIQAVSDTYNGININGRRLFIRSGLSWVKLLHTCFWEFLIVIGLFGALLTSLAAVPEVLYSCGVCSRVLGFWGVLGFLGIPCCVAFAHLMVVGSLAKVLSLLESECYGLESLIKAKSFMERKRQTALVMDFLSNVGFRLVECVFEFRMCKGMSLWEGPMLVSMYSLVFVLDTVMNVVFYYACKP